ncbi:MAG: response regulator transcription factor [Solirubrobacterales bacterium]|nr:response regulator transcription factor [Solirubrobacterales bacterium]
MTIIKTGLATTAEEVAVLPSLDRGVGNHTAVLRVVIADDHPLFRQAVRGAIERYPGLALVGEAEDGQQALELIDTLEPDVAVLDHRMPALTGAEVCEVLHGREYRPATALLMLSAFEDADLVWGAVSSGAAGYIGKGASPNDICKAIEEVGRGGIAFTPSASSSITEGFARHFGRSDHLGQKRPRQR